MSTEQWTGEERVRGRTSRCGGGGCRRCVHVVSSTYMFVVVYVYIHLLAIEDLRRRGPQHAIRSDPSCPAGPTPPRIRTQLRMVMF
jgi:hypothetical protein